MFAGNVAAGDEIGDGITSSMTILYDLDATQLGTVPENNNSWDWNSNISTASSNYAAGQSYVYCDQGMNIENGDRSQKLMYQESLWNETYPSVHQNYAYDQNGYNQPNYQHYDSSYIDSNKPAGQMQSAFDNFVVSNYNPTYSQHGRNTSCANTQFTPQQLANGYNNSYQQHGLQQRNVLQSFGTTTSGANYKILPSKKFVVGNIVAREYPQLGQRGMLPNAFARKSLGGTYQGQPMPVLKNRLGQLGHGLIRVVHDSNTNVIKKPPLVFHDPPYQRQKPSYVQPPPPEYAENDESSKNSDEKQFSPTAIELVSASTDEEEWETRASPHMVVVKTVSTRNAIFGHKKLKFRCMRCGNRDATFNSQLTHAKSHRKPYCMQCCWVGDHAVQLKAHVEKAHPKIDTGSGVTMVTSKYGRKCQVNTSVAVGLKRRKISAKSPQNLVPNLADVEDEKPQLKVPLPLKIKTERVEKVEDREDFNDVKIERFSPVPKAEKTKGRVQSETKLAGKLAPPPTRELSKRRLVLMAKNAPKEEKLPAKDKFFLKEDETPPSKRRIVRKEDRTPQSKDKIAPKKDDTPSSKSNTALKEGTSPPKGKISLVENGTSLSKGTTVPRELREMPKRVLRKK